VWKPIPQTFLFRVPHLAGFVQIFSPPLLCPHVLLGNCNGDTFGAESGIAERGRVESG
jgi:hypothetical protein